MWSKSFSLAAIKAALALLISLGAPTTHAADVTKGPRMYVEGDMVFFDGDVPVSKDPFYDGKEDDDAISGSDADRLQDLLEANPNVTRIRLTSRGGSMFAGFSLLRLISDYGLDTYAYKACSSSCAVAFLGGRNRVLMKGALIGLHSPGWGEDALNAMDGYFQDFKQEKGWADPIEFAAWTYRFGQEQSAEAIRYLVDNGVSFDMALKTLDYAQDEMWYPTRQELEEGGFLRTFEGE